MSEEAIKVKRISIDDKKYLLDKKTNMVYDTETHKHIGFYIDGMIKTKLPIELENIKEFATILIEKNYSYLFKDLFPFICLFKNMCMKNVVYMPIVNERGIKIKHEWVLTNIKDGIENVKILNVKDFRQLFMDDIKEVFEKIEYKYINELQCINNAEQFREHEQIQRYINISTNLHLSLVRSGKLFKEFIDCYRLGYFDD